MQFLRSVARYPVVSPSLRWCSSVPSLSLNEISDNPGAKKTSKRLGRGIGSRKGKTAGRGHKGAGARSGSEAGPGFEGGQTPMYKRVRKYGFRNGRYRVDYVPLNLDKIQYYIDTGRLDPQEVITLRTLRERKVLPHLKEPVKLLSQGHENFKTPITIEVSAVSQKAREAVESAGGKVRTVYFNKLGLRTFLRKPLEDIDIKFAAAPEKIADRYDVPQYQLDGK